jgi:hypothetical protein
VGLDRAARQTAGARAPLLAVAVVVLLAVSALRELPTAGSYFGGLSGGAARIVERRIFDPGDGSELSPLLRAVDEGGGQAAAIHAPDVPAGYFEALQGLGRSRTALQGGKRERRTQFSIVRGEQEGATARVVRDGAVLWSLVPEGS